MNLYYLDNNSTTPIDPAVQAEMIRTLKTDYGNPSSAHQIGQGVRKEIEEAREQISNYLKIKPVELVFTSCGTEANNMAIRGVAKAYRGKGNHIITTCIEHPSVLNTCKYLEDDGYEVDYLGVNEFGEVDLEELKSKIKDTTILITIMHANNEIGTIQPLKEIGKIAKENKVLFHSDAVQTLGKMEIHPKELGVDLLSFSGHKFYAPKGVGALYIRNGVKIDKVITGGHQERNRRPGTENVIGILGMAKALEVAYKNMEEEWNREKQLRDMLENLLIERIPEVKVNGHKENRLPGTLSLTIKYVEGESILLNLDLKGIAVSSGSACSSGSLEPSHVILAIGVPMEHAHGTIRFSLGRFNTEDDIKYVADTLPEIVEKIRSMSPFWNSK